MVRHRRTWRRETGLFLLFFLIWLTLSGEVTLGSCLLGALVSLALYAFCVRQLGYAPRYDLLGVKKLRQVLSYMGYLVAEIL